MVKKEKFEVHNKTEGEISKFRKLKDLDADLLTQVFSYLPQKILFQIMLISRHWNKAVREGTVLWKEINVFWRWDMDGKGNQMIHRILSFAEEVTFSRFMSSGHILSLAGVDRPYLRVLVVPNDIAGTAVLLPLLSSACPQLEWLSLVSVVIAPIQHPIHISHSKLQTLDLPCIRTRSVTIHCRGLTQLSTAGRNFPIAVAAFPRDVLPPSLHCPLLTDLRLSALHSTSNFLGRMAAHAPRINTLYLDCLFERPDGALTHFRSLQTLKLYNCEGMSPHAFDQWPLLHTLLLSSRGRTEALDLCHRGLRSLKIVDFVLPPSAMLTCPSLEELTLDGNNVSTPFVEKLSSLCPRLKRLIVRRGKPLVEEGPLDFVHATLEELQLRGLSYSPLHVTCPKLTKLIMHWKHEISKPMPRLEGRCPNLTKLKLGSYSSVLWLPTILATFPSLESLYFSEMVILEWQLCLEHPRIQMVWLCEVEIIELSLLMPSLVRRRIGRSRVLGLLVASK